MARSIFWTIVTALLLIPAITWADTPDDIATRQASEALVGDRPDVTESSATVPRGRLQLEGGVDYSYVNGGGAARHGVHGLNLLGRYGVADFAELRLGVPNLDYERADGASDTRFGAVELGAKLATTLGEGMRTGLLPYVELGVEDIDASGGLIATFAYDVTDTIGLGLNAGASGQLDDTDQLAISGMVSAAIGAELSDSWGVFAEGFAESSDGGADVFADTGLTYLLTPTLQLDAYVGTDTQSFDTLFGGVGAVALF